MVWTRNVFRSIKNTALDTLKKRGVKIAAGIATEYAMKKLGKQSMKLISGNTKTKQKTKQRKVQKIETNSIKEFDTRNMSIILNPKMKGKTKGNWTYTQITQRKSASLAGTQGSSIVLTLLRNNNFTIPSDPGFDENTTAIRLGDMNPYKNTSGSQLFGPQIPAADRFGIKSIDVHMEIVNGHNIPVVLDLYYIMHKTDNEIGISNNWTDCLIAEGMGKAAYRVPPAGFTRDGTTIMGGSLRDNFPGQQPFRLTQFRRNYKLLKKVTVNLQVGVNELLKTRIVYNKVIQPNAHTGDKVKGVTIEVLAIQRGIVIFDTTGDAVLPTYGNSLVGYVNTVTYNMCGVYSNAGRLDTSYGASAIPYNAAPENQSHMNEDSEVIEPLRFVA